MMTNGSTILQRPKDKNKTITYHCKAFNTIPHFIFRDCFGCFLTVSSGWNFITLILCLYLSKYWLIKLLNFLGLQKLY